MPGMMGGFEIIQAGIFLEKLWTGEKI